MLILLVLGGNLLGFIVVLKSASRGEDGAVTRSLGLVISIEERVWTIDASFRACGTSKVELEEFSIAFPAWKTADLVVSSFNFKEARSNVSDYRTKRKMSCRSLPLLLLT